MGRANVPNCDRRTLPVARQVGVSPGLCRQNTYAAGANTDASLTSAVARIKLRVDGSSAPCEVPRANERGSRTWPMAPHSQEWNALWGGGGVSCARRPSRPPTPPPPPPPPPPRGVPRHLHPVALRLQVPPQGRRASARVRPQPQRRFDGEGGAHDARELGEGGGTVGASVGGHPGEGKGATTAAQFFKSNHCIILIYSIKAYLIILMLH